MTVPADLPEPTPPHVAEWLRRTAAEHTPGPVDDIGSLRARIQGVQPSDPRGRSLDEVQHQITTGPLDRADWPSIGDEVIYHHPDGRWLAATVLDVAEHDGDLRLDYGDGPDLAALDVKHGSHPHGWLLYREAPGAVAGKTITKGEIEMDNAVAPVEWAEILRSAARQMEGRAKAANTERARLPYGDEKLQPVPESEWGALVDNYLGGPMGAHCAALTPTFVVFLAAWLEDEAYRIEDTPYRVDADWIERNYRASLAVARAYLGTQP